MRKKNHYLKDKKKPTFLIYFVSNILMAFILLPFIAYPSTWELHPVTLWISMLFCALVSALVLKIILDNYSIIEQLEYKEQNDS